MRGYCGQKIFTFITTLERFFDEYDTHNNNQIRTVVMTSYNQDGKVGPRAREKLDCLGAYLTAYATILSKKEWCTGYFYLDAFAGCGESEVRKPEKVDVSESSLYPLLMLETLDDPEEREFIQGSPLMALQSMPKFTEYYFVEIDSERASQLRMSLSEYEGDRKFRVIPGSASEILSRFARSPKLDWRTQRAVVFLDPFGMQVQWRTIQELAQTKAIEIFLNFPVGMGIQRLLPKTGVTSNHRQQLNEYFGSSEWESELYKSHTDMFGDESVEKVQKSGDHLALWYRDRLKQEFGYAAAPRLIRNTTGGHLYYLIFAGPNKTGAKIADHILKQGETVR